MQGIIIFGASGSGTTTIGKALVKRMNCAHFDIDDYFWEDTSIPFTVQRDREKRIKLLLSDLKNTNGFVMSGNICGWDDEFIPFFNLAVFVETDVDIRIKRLKNREVERFGDRIKMGGDMHEEHMTFIQWAKSYDTGGLDQRSKALHEQWIKKLNCRVVRVDGSKDTKENLDIILELLNRGEAQ